MPKGSKATASEHVEVEGYEGHETGDAYYAPPGHTPVLFEGTEIVEFSPTAELDRTFAVVTRNMQAASEASGQSRAAVGGRSRLRRHGASPRWISMDVVCVRTPDGRSAAVAVTA
jgi:hypothetical protein